MKEKLQKIGTIVTIQGVGTIMVQVKIVDFKNSYGRDRWLVEPVSGTGNAWVEKIYE